MKVLGMISGTSHDGIDVAVVDLTLTGDVLTGAVAARRQHALPARPAGPAGGRASRRRRRPSPRCASSTR